MDKGFTLLELVIVITIISILSFVALPVYNKYIAKAKFLELIQIAGTAKLVINQHYILHGSLPAGEEVQAELTELVQPYLGKVTSLEFADSLTLLINASYLGLAQDEEVYLSFFPELSSLGLNWRCVAKGPSTLLPHTCHAVS